MTSILLQPTAAVSAIDETAAAGTSTKQINRTNRLAHTSSAPTLLRSAEPKDVSEIAALINHYAALGQMLPRKEESVCQNIGEFSVVESNHKVIACGALHRWDDESAEVRSLAVVEEYAGQGLGRQIVHRLLERGVARGFDYAFALTLQARFFEKLSFQVVKKSALPQKVWGDCIICPFLYNCHETALVKHLKTKSHPLPFTLEGST